jgi:hypothetical protein
MPGVAPRLAQSRISSFGTTSRTSKCRTVEWRHPAEATPGPSVLSTVTAFGRGVWWSPLRLSQLSQSARRRLAVPVPTPLRKALARSSLGTSGGATRPGPAATGGRPGPVSRCGRQGRGRSRCRCGKGLQRHIGLTCALSSWAGTPAAACPLSRDSGAGAASACTPRRRTRSDRVPSPALRPSFKERSRRIRIRAAGLRSSHAPPVRPPARPHPMVRPRNAAALPQSVARRAMRPPLRRSPPRPAAACGIRRAAAARGFVRTGRAPLPLAGCGEDPIDRSVHLGKALPGDSTRRALTRAGSGSGRGR